MDRLPPQVRSANMREIRGEDTAPELAVRRIAHGMGFRYRLHVAGLPGKPDLVFARLRKIVEVRGCFWHQHPGCIDSHIPKSRVDYWGPKLTRNVRRDGRNQRLLQALGWSVLTVWECQTKHAGPLARKLARFLRAG